VAFTLQDFDGDNVISKSDLKNYMRRIADNQDGVLDEDEYDRIIQEIMDESSSAPERDYLTFQDFQAVVAPMDYQAKLLLPI
jgi:Ca2+-binding EF-hand superfamily protein